jgi:ATP-dependent Lon protease
LVKKSRTTNAKEFYKLIKSENRHENTCEIDYFKKKLSNTEQKNIMKELEEINKHMNIDKPYRLALLQSSIPPKYKATILLRLNMMLNMEPCSGEYHKMKCWVDNFYRIPFGIYKNLSVNINDGKEVCNNYLVNAKKTLDETVYGMEDAKIQILQMIGQWITNPSAMGTAIAIHGSAGVGKTSIVKDGISKILGREFAFISLGGNSDASFLEGHSFTYEAANYGKIAQILIDSKCMNPVIYFDELDKISDTPKGEEITGILTHLTDTTQNNQFHDKYFSEIDFDLSKCLFIFSYNDESKINPILKDRMYNIHVKGYETKDKIVIANKYLLPKIREQVNFKEGDIMIPDDVLSYIITNQKMTQKEEGVRNLKRCLEIIHTKINLLRLVDNDKNKFLGKDLDITIEFPFTVTKENVDLFIKTDGQLNQSVLAMYI